MPWLAPKLALEVGISVWAGKRRASALVGFCRSMCTCFCMAVALPTFVTHSFGQRRHTFHQLSPAPVQGHRRGLVGQRRDRGLVGSRHNRTTAVGGSGWALAGALV
eukprot:364415-Chlamydomonas_euryale.AAC.3